MTEHEVLAAVGIGEDSDWEFKAAQGGLPGSLWETYSGMANTDGGIIVLGVKEKDGVFEIAGLPNPVQIRKAVWDNVNDHGKVSLNLLSEGDVAYLDTLGKTVLVIKVPRADRRQRPVYVGQNPLTGTYRRNYEGDYHCRPDEVGRMLADQGEESPDARILTGFGFDDLDPESLQKYRIECAQARPTHAWRSLDDATFLMRLRAYRKDRRTGEEGLTVAGLLMFGKSEAILDPDVGLDLSLDYREHLSEDPQIRWTDRLTGDGTWACNISQFFRRVLQRLYVDLKLAFELETNLFRRKDESIVHEAVREALVNAIVHADYRGQGGVIVEKYRDRLEFSNPGNLLLDIEQILKGGVSECRNKLLQAMFAHWGYAEKAGSGIDTIRQGWRSQKWRSPLITEKLRPDRVIVELPMISLLPEESLRRLRGAIGAPFERLSALEVQALVTADVEKQVTNARVRQVCDEHATDITKLLQGLVGKGLLEQDGHKRGTVYRLKASVESPETPDVDTLHKPEDSLHTVVDSLRTFEELPKEDRGRLEAIAEPARRQKRLSVEETEALVLSLCRGFYLSREVLGELMRRNSGGLRDRILTPMVRAGALAYLHKGEPKHPRQAYTTVDQD